MTVLLSSAALLPIALLASVSCQGDECRVGEAMCDGNRALNCELPGDDPGLEFTGGDCGERVCVIASQNGGQYALCALESEPHPACSSDAFDRVCDGPRLLLCSRGFVVERSDCGDSNLCEASVPFCLVQPGPDPVCQAAIHDGSFADFCEGDTLVGCYEAFRIEEEECGSGLCYDGEPFPSCIASSTPDPRCEAHFDPMLASVFCDGNTLVKCDAQFLVEEHDCGSALCSKPEGHAFAECN